MSDLLGGAGQADISIEADDKRAMSPWYMRPYGHAYGALAEFIPDAPAVGARNTPWWPGCGGLLGSQDVDVGAWAPQNQQAVYYCTPDMTRGSAYIFGLSGVTRDVYGSPVGGVTVKLYLTAAQGNVPADTVVCTTTSDPNGNFAVSSPYYTQHYLVMYKAGTPDIFATTSNQLVGV